MKRHRINKPVSNRGRAVFTPSKKVRGRKMPKRVSK